MNQLTKVGRGPTFAELRTIKRSFFKYGRNKRNPSKGAEALLNRDEE